MQQYRLPDDDKPSIAVNLTKVLLILVNLGFIIVGGLLVYFTVRVRNSGALDIFKGGYSWIQGATFLAALVFGAIVVAISLVGCIGAFMRNRLVIFFICDMTSNCVN